jgi:AraC-like DNA-binding protein
MSSRHIANLAPDATARWQALARHALWDAGRAAELLDISLRQLERLCQRDLNCTPSEWLHHERMAAAADLLAAGRPIKSVAAHLGYTRPANFSRDFKRHFGRTPRAFAPRLFAAAALPDAPADSPPHLIG